MSQPQPQWQIQPSKPAPPCYLETIKKYTSVTDGKYLAQLLWQREISELENLPGFLNADYYQPTSPFAFGQEMKWATERIIQARNQSEKVAIWGDFDADGVTATSVLWEGLANFLQPGKELLYYIPNRLQESHGLNCPGIEKLSTDEVKLIITCDTGSTNLAEIKYAQELSIDIIITDHHTLPAERPRAVAIINPRYFAETHPLYHLSGVAVAYKLVEALYATLPQIAQQPLENLPGFLNADYYQPTSPFAFGQEMKWATERIIHARNQSEKVAIWGDFDADGVTATSVLLEGLANFFQPQKELCYYIPNRLKESHGLNFLGIEKLSAAGVKLIITCDTGSTNLEEIKYAQELGIDTIITDHHTLPAERPDAVAIINPRYFAETHPLYYLSGVAVAYKLVEALSEILPQLPQQPLENLLDLVAIGLVADLVKLKGDCRYLAQKGIQKLQQTQRPGVAQLLKLCQKTGDRPMDIAFGLGPRINAVSRIQGDASFCVELLTNRDKKGCHKLAYQAELANTRRKSLQSDIVKNVKKKLEQIDLSTTSVIVLEDEGWNAGVLGLVAGQIAQEYGRPTILLSTQQSDQLARGSARSIHNIDLYESIASQKHLLTKFGGHPFAAGLSLSPENIPLFRDGINQQLKQQVGDLNSLVPTIEVDLVVEVAELGQDLFKELKILEPCGMGNPIPKLLLKNCWFKVLFQQRTKDLRGQKTKYQKVNFQVFDNSVTRGFPGVWWGHSRSDLPQEQLCDAVVELDFNAYEQNYQVRLIDIQASRGNYELDSDRTGADLWLDWRGEQDLASQDLEGIMLLEKCPFNWEEIRLNYNRAKLEAAKLALAYKQPPELAPEEIWSYLVGVAKHLARTKKKVTKSKIQQKLGLSDRLFGIGLQALETVGFVSKSTENNLEFSFHKPNLPLPEQKITTFLAAVAEAQFKRQYFYQVPLTTLKTTIE